MPLRHASACSVQYLQQPEKVFAEIYRVLKPGGVAIFSFSNRMFFTKVLTLLFSSRQHQCVLPQCSAADLLLVEHA